VSCNNKLAKLFGGQQNVQEAELLNQPSLLLDYLKEIGHVQEIKNLVRITVHTLANTTFEVIMADDENNQVRRLKKQIEDKEGTSCFAQQLFRMTKCSDEEQMEDSPLLDDDVLTVSCSIALCVQIAAEKWDMASPLLVEQFTLSGPNCSTATKIANGGSYHNCLMVAGTITKTVCPRSVNRISFKLTQGSAPYMMHYCGCIRDGAAPDEDHAVANSTKGWFINSASGTLYGNGKYHDDKAGRIYDGQILSMESDLAAGTLRFYLDGKPHGPGFTNLTGRLRWAAVVVEASSGVQIVPTPQLHPWVEWIRPSRTKISS
jgi:hypothetical protein